MKCRHLTYGLTFSGVLAVTVGMGLGQRLDVVLVTDVSPSMAHNDDSAATRKTGQAIFFHTARLSESARAGLVLFTEEIVKALPLESIPTDQASFDRLVTEYEPKDCGRNTDLANALDKALQLLDQAKGPAQDPPPAKIVILLSDGDFERVCRFIDGTPPAWWSNSLDCKSKKVLGDVIRRYQKQGVILHTIPATPLVYGKQGVQRYFPRFQVPLGDDEKQILNAWNGEGTLLSHLKRASVSEKSELYSRVKSWQACNDLLQQLAAATNGKTFVRTDALSFPEIYSQIFMDASGGGSRLSLAGGKCTLHGLHHTVMIAGPNLVAVRFANGQRQLFPGAGETARVAGKATALGTEYSFQRFGDGLGMAIFRRPTNLTAETMAAWAGEWTVESRSGTDVGLLVTAFSDLSLSWEPPLRTRRWRSEKPTVDMTFKMDITGLPNDAPWVRSMLSSLSCEAALVDSNGRPIWPEKKRTYPADVAARRFRLDLDFPVAGQYELRLAVRASHGQHTQVIYRIVKPIQVVDDPVVLLGYVRSESGQRVGDPVFNTGAEQRIRPMEQDDALDVDIVTTDPQRFTIESVKVDPAATVDDNPRQWRWEPPQRSKSPQPGYSFRARPSARARSSQAKAVPVEVTVSDKADNSKAVLSLVLPRPNLGDQAKDRFGQLAPVGRMGEPVLVHEDARLPFEIRLQGIQAEEFEPRDPLFVALTLTENELLGTPFRALLNRQKSTTTALAYDLVLEPPHFRRRGRVELRVSPGQLPFPIQQSLGFDVKSMPLELTLAQDDRPLRGDRTLRSGEQIQVRLHLPQAAQEGVVARGLELHEIVDGARRECLARADLRPADSKETYAAVIPLLNHDDGVLMPVLKVDVPRSDAGQPRPAVLHLPETEWYQLRRVPVALTWETRALGQDLRALGPIAAETEFRIQGGMPEDRKAAVERLKKFIANHGPDRFHVSFSPDDAVRPERFEIGTPAVLGDPERQSVRFVVPVKFVLTRAGRIRLLWKIRQEDFPGIELPPAGSPPSRSAFRRAPQSPALRSSPRPVFSVVGYPRAADEPPDRLETSEEINVRPPLRYCRVKQVEILKDCVLDTSVDKPLPAEHDAVAGFGCAVSFPPGDNGGPRPQKSTYRVFWDDALVGSTDDVAANETPIEVRIPPVTAGPHTLRCEVADATGETVVWYPPQTITAKPLTWEFSPAHPLPRFLPVETSTIAWAFRARPAAKELVARVVRTAIVFEVTWSNHAGAVSVVAAEEGATDPASLLGERDLRFVWHRPSGAVAPPWVDGETYIVNIRAVHSATEQTIGEPTRIPPDVTIVPSPVAAVSWEQNDSTPLAPPLRLSAPATIVVRLQEDPPTLAKLGIPSGQIEYTIATLAGDAPARTARTLPGGEPAFRLADLTEGTHNIVLKARLPLPPSGTDASAAGPLVIEIEQALLAIVVEPAPLPRWALVMRYARAVSPSVAVGLTCIFFNYVGVLFARLQDWSDGVRGKHYQSRVPQHVTFSVANHRALTSEVHPAQTLVPGLLQATGRGQRRRTVLLPAVLMVAAASFSAYLVHESRREPEGPWAYGLYVALALAAALFMLPTGRWEAWERELKRRPPLSTLIKITQPDGRTAHAGLVECVAADIFFCVRQLGGELKIELDGKSAEQAVTVPGLSASLLRALQQRDGMFSQPRAWSLQRSGSVGGTAHLKVSRGDGGAFWLLDVKLVRTDSGHHGNTRRQGDSRPVETAPPGTLPVAMNKTSNVEERI